ncbi:MAG: AAA family ATPase [Clostridia bacterium]|nr:AAA family ATPase [Clostridia bacterium]
MPKINLTEKDRPYGDNFEYLADLKKSLDLKIYFYLKELINSTRGETYNLKGLVIPREEVVDFLSKLDGESAGHHLCENESRENHKVLRDLENFIAKRIELTLKTDVFLPLKYLCQVFGLNDFEKHCLALSLLVHYDRVYQRIFGYIQDDISLKYPNLDTAIKLFSPRASEQEVLEFVLLFEKRLAKFFFQQADSAPVSLSLPLQLDKRILDIILGNDEESFPPFLRLFYPGQALPPLIIQKDIQERMQNLIKGGGQNIFYFYGPPGSGKRLQIKHLAHKLGRAVIFADVTKLISSDGSWDEINLNKTLREIILYNAVFCLENFKDVTAGNTWDSHSVLALLEEIGKEADLLFVVDDTEEPLPELRAKANWLEVRFNLPSRREQKELWLEFSREFPLEKGMDVGELANKFQLMPGQIFNALKQAWVQARWQGKEAITKKNLYEACYQQISHNLSEKATLIKARYGFDHLILPPAQKRQLISACNQVRFKHIVYDEWGFEEKLAYGKGLSMLFAGPPGTGKTMAAQVIAGELGLELYKIDLSQVVSKYIGETEKNLKEIFAEGEKSNVILFFDEVDVLMGKRTEQKDAHDKYANLEVAFLLQSMEDYQGISIMATNFLQNIDSAFIRRLNYVIHFPFPDVEHRKKIWQSIFPKKMPLASDDIDYEYLAKQFEITGGNIKNIALVAAFMAAERRETVAMKHILGAVKNELEKQGKVLLKQDFGEYAFYLDKLKE